jgi:hypothetical protein
MTRMQGVLLAGAAAFVAAGVALWGAQGPATPSPAALADVPCDSCTARHKRLTRAQEKP